MIRAATYLRVSTKEQAEGKASIPEQRETCNRAVAEHHGKWEFFREYSDAGLSGHLMEERPGLQALMKDAREHSLDLVVVKDFDRFARNRAGATAVREELKELGIQTYAVTTPLEPKDPTTYDPDEDDLGVIVEGMSDIRSDLERKAITRRMKMGKMYKAKNGSIPNTVPFGYKIKRNIDERGKIQREVFIDDGTVDTITLIYTLFTVRGLGNQKIANELNKRKLRAPRSTTWTAQAVKYILRNPTYTGKVWWGWRHADYKKTKDKRRRGQVGIIVQGKHPAIISEETFEKARAIQQERATHARGGAERSRGLLTGLLRCIRCGNSGSYLKRNHKRSRQNKGWNDTTTFEYICGGYKYKGVCSPRIMSATRLEGEVLDHIRNLYSHPKVQEKIVYKGNQQTMRKLERELAKLKRERARIPERLQRQQEAFESKAITTMDYGEAMKRLREQEAHYEAEIVRTQSALIQLDQNSEMLKKYAATLRKFDVMWEKLTFDEQRLILRTIIKQIRAGEGRVEIDFVL